MTHHRMTLAALIMTALHVGFWAPGGRAGRAGDILPGWVAPWVPLLSRPPQAARIPSSKAVMMSTAEVILWFAMVRGGIAAVLKLFGRI